MKYRLSVLVSNTLELLLCDKPAASDCLHKLQTLRVVAVGPIHAVQNTIDGHLTQQARERREGEHAARGNPDVAVPDRAEVALPRWPAALCLTDVDDAVELEGEHFSHVPNDDLEAREFVEEATIEQAQNVKADLLI